MTPEAIHNKFHDTATIMVALQRDPSFIVRVVHELANSPEMFPSLMGAENIRSNENVIASKNVSPRVVDYQLFGVSSIKETVQKINLTLPWVAFPYTNVMLSLYRGFFPKLYSPNSLFTYLASLTDADFLAVAEKGLPEVDELLSRGATFPDLIESVESIWNLKFPRIQFKFGPVSPQDLLVSASAYDDLIIMHPMAPFSSFWPGILVYKLTRLLLQKHYPQMGDRFKEQLSILTVRATLGKALDLPGTCHDVMRNHPVDHAQYQVELISRDLRNYDDFDHRLLHFFPSRSLDDNYTTDMIVSLLLFLIEEGQFDERDLFARISASAAGYKKSMENFLLFQDALPQLERMGIIKKDESAGVICVNGIDAGDLPRDGASRS